MAGLLAVAVCAVLAGATSFTAITDGLPDLAERARDRLGFGRGVPVGTTVWRLPTLLDDRLLATDLAGCGPAPGRSHLGHAGVGR
ncbi:transposase family protein [Micromonospora sp. NPDC092111]|uniref:transposase family protein n=1 Tax=Micromonospora sp. NPDC092111 TaxID=3364289 RepID=UPI00381D0D99